MHVDPAITSKPGIKVCALIRKEAGLFEVALPVLRHRIVTNFNAEADGVNSDVVVQTLLNTIPLDATTNQRPLGTLIK